MHYQQPETFQHIHFDIPDFPINYYTIADSTTMPHWHNELEIVHIVKGHVSVHINGKQYDCDHNDIIFIPSGGLHSIIPNGHAIYYAIVIEGDLFTSLFESESFNSILGFSGIRPILHPFAINSKDALFQTCVGTVKTIVDELKKREPLYKAVVLSQLLQFFSYIQREFTEDASLMQHIFPVSSHDEDIKGCIEYLMQHYKEKITIQDMSRRMNLSDQHFSRLFKVYTGSTFVNYLTRLRLEEANKLLIHSTLPVTLIPELIGFCNANYFSRIYHKYYGQSPSATRKMASPRLNR